MKVNALVIEPLKNVFFKDINLSKKNNHEIEIEWYDKKSLCIVLCSKGYPDTFKKNQKINNISKIKFKKGFF